MALSNFDELVKSISTWSHRNDIGTLIPDFIALAETEMFSNDDETLETREEEETATLTAIGTTPNESRFIELPSDFLNQRDLKILIQNDTFNLIYRIPAALIIRSGTGTPCRFTETDKIELDIVPDQDYTITMKYYAKPEPLTKSNTKNQILTNNPNIYLYGALHQLFLFSESDNEATK